MNFCLVIIITPIYLHTTPYPLALPTPNPLPHSPYSNPLLGHFNWDITEIPLGFPGLRFLEQICNLNEDLFP